MDVSLDVNFRGPALGEAVFTKGGFAKDDIAKAMAASRPGVDHLDAVLFMDVDGVLHPFQTRSRIQFCTECLQALKAIVQSDCHPTIILSSAWRTDPQGRSEVSVQLGLHGIPTFRDWTKVHAQSLSLCSRPSASPHSNSRLSASLHSNALPGMFP